jgi:glycosyltransferase involved in cell wall biosynthesis
LTLRVLIVSAHGADAWRGGVERGLHLVASELTARGIEVSVLRSGAGGEANGIRVLNLYDRSEEDTRARIRNRLIDLASHPSARLRAIVEQEAPDVIHTHNLPGIGTAVWKVAQLRRIPVVHSLHDYYLLCPRMTLMTRSGEPCGTHPVCELRRRRLAGSSSAVSVVTGVSMALLRAHAHLFGRARIEVLRNPMAAYNDIVFPQTNRSPLTIGYIGSLAPEKGTLALLDAAERLHGAPCKFHVAGTGRLAKLVTSRAASLTNLHYFGSVKGEAKEEFIAQCDVGIIPSVWAEPGGPTQALIEWLTARRPVLLSRRGGLAECASLGGTVAIEPTGASIEAEVRRLVDESVRQDLSNSIGTWDRDGELARWVDRHLELYALAHAAAS